jgi:hypothetical protein
MYSPALLERVHLRGRDGIFLVTRVDHEEKVADLLPFTHSQLAKRDVPFGMLEPSVCASPEMLRPLPR